MSLRTGIRGKMIALIALPTLAVYIGVLGAVLIYLSNVNRQEVERQMTERAVDYAARFDGAFREAAAIARTTAGLVETSPDLTAEQIDALLRGNVLRCERVYGAAMAFEPGTHPEGDDLFCPYVHRSGDGLRSMNITRDVLDWYGDDRWQWWHRPRASGQPVWTDPYFDDGAGNVLMVTFAAPFTRGGRFRGVTTVDVRVSSLGESIGQAIGGDTSFVVLTRDGRFVYSRLESAVTSESTVFDLADEIGSPALAAAGQEFISGRTGVTTIAAFEEQPPPGWEQFSETQWVFYAPIESTGWALVASLPERVALADVRSRMTLASIALAVTLLLIIGCIVLAAKLFTTPIADLAGAVRRIASGDLGATLDVTRRDELGDLGRDVNAMAVQIKAHVEETARQRAGSREAMIFALAKLAESRDDDTGKHLERICLYVEVLAKKMSRDDPALDENWLRTVVATAALHDIGKVGIPDGVLKKPGRLTDEERRVMQTHTTIGGDTLLAVKQQWTEDDFLRIATEIALGHHERWDGTGYPFGQSGENIGLAARIVAVADVYDALTSKRVYKDAMPHEKARGIIVDGSGSHFDPTVVEAFVATEDELRMIAETVC